MVSAALKERHSKSGTFGPHSGSKKVEGQLRLDPTVYEKLRAESLCYACGNGDGPSCCRCLGKRVAPLMAAKIEAILRLFLAILQSLIPKEVFA